VGVRGGEPRKLLLGQLPHGIHKVQFGGCQHLSSVVYAISQCRVYAALLAKYPLAACLRGTPLSRLVAGFTCSLTI
jgi:hypothetical protein